ncbi:MAG: biotin carboxylase N-terminal domain-containing protein [Aestuariivita sp.]|uniref:acetyl-CoA carboxylase biotin carboxylase subunit n=1 Tax=Aestuariivita sp. TaxID=1872407 RepID=UPI003BB219FC
MKRILVANRGEIACRVIRAAQDLGLETVTVHSDADAEALHVEMADAAVRIGPPPAAESYLRQEAILAAARETGAHAIHPGYGFMAENADFARAVQAAGLIWIGPRPETIEAMGDKQRARRLAQEAGVPVARGSDRILPGATDGLEELAEGVGYPLLVKAAAGGGGIGMRRVDGPETLRKTVEATQSMAERSFGDGSIYLERFIPRARHIEIQVFGFGDGRAVHLFERDCSLQRRFQKIVEESPAPGFSREAVAAMAEAARALAASQHYTGAGTVEFVADADTGEFFFLEMNTRIQVEHPVTEMVTGCDLVGLQLRLAAGEDLHDMLTGVAHSGVAMECRLYAENPAKNFLPSPGTLVVFDLPDGLPGIRIDAGVRAGDSITPYYDPMIAKFIAWGEDRGTAIDRLRDALAATQVEGLATNRDFLIAVLGDPDFRAGAIWTGFVEERRKSLIP